MIIRIIKNYKRRTAAQAWQQIREEKSKKEQAVQKATPTVATVKTTPTVPVHPLHVVFDKSYLNKQQPPDVAELAKISEEVKYLRYHDHHQQFAY